MRARHIDRMARLLIEDAHCSISPRRRIATRHHDHERSTQELNTAQAAAVIRRKYPYSTGARLNALAKLVARPRKKPAAK